MSVIILTLYITSMKIAIWLAKTCRKADVCLQRVIFQEINPE
jgi:hypothetical protein